MRRWGRRKEKGIVVRGKEKDINRLHHLSLHVCVCASICMYACRGEREEAKGRRGGETENVSEWPCGESVNMQGEQAISIGE